MRKLSRRFRVERLESRCLFAALGLGDQPTHVASVPLQDSASIDVSEVQGLRGAALEISFDHQRLQVDPRDVRAGSAWGGRGLSIANVDNEEGTINIFLFSARETELGHGSLVEIDFRRSDRDPDGLLPSIDVNRLRLNDTEISFTDSDSTASKDHGSDNLPKLSLQFKIAPEGESPLATYQQDESVADGSASDAGPSHLPDDPWNHEQAILPAIHDGWISDNNPSESTDRIALHSHDVCRPAEMDRQRVDLAINQWFSNGAALKGPLEPLVEQDWMFYAPASARIVDEMEMELLLPSGTQKIEHEATRLPEFSPVPSAATRRGVIRENDHQPKSIVWPALQQLDDQLSNVRFQSELAMAAVSRLHVART